MNTCPHCQTPANPLRLLVMTRQHPYRCGHCRELSVLLPRHNTIAALLTLALGLFFAGMILVIGFWLALALFAVLYVVIIGAIVSLFMRLVPAGPTRK